MESQTWEGSVDSWFPPFLDFICPSASKTGGRLAYITYQVWLSRNKLVFEVEITPSHRVFKRVVFLAMEFHQYDADTTSLASSDTCDSRAALEATYSVTPQKKILLIRIP